MYKFLYFNKQYCSGLSLDEIVKARDLVKELFVYAVDKSGKVSSVPTVISADKITNIEVM